MTKDVSEAPLSRKRKIQFSFITLCIACVIGYGIFKFKTIIYDLILWDKLVHDVDHRLQPDPKETISADGVRSDKLPDAYNKDQFNVIVAGDSFTVGYMLPFTSAPPYQLELLLRDHYKSANINVVNFGWTGASPYLSLRLLKEKGASYKPDVVIMFLDLTDFKDDFFYRHVVERQGHYGFLIDHPVLGYFMRSIAAKTDAYTGWNTALLGYPDFSTYFVVHQPYEKSVPYFDNTYEILLQVNDYVTHQLGAKLYVFMPPRHWQYTDKESPNSWEKHAFQVMGPHALNNFRYIAEKQAISPFPFVSLLEDFKNADVFPTTFNGDSHWNENGAKLAAQSAFRHCVELKCFEGADNPP